MPVLWLLTFTKYDFDEFLMTWSTSYLECMNAYKQMIAVKFPVIFFVA